MITAAVEVISGPWGQPAILLVVMPEDAAAAVSSAADTGDTVIRDSEIPAARNPASNFFIFINNFSCF